MENDDIKILIVDDDEINCECAEMNLKRFIGYSNFASADDGVTGLEYLEKNRDVDIIFLDRMMVHMNGISMLNKMNENPEYKDITVIFQTGDVGNEEKQECMEAGSLYLLQKPYNTDDQKVFINSIANLIRAKRRIKEKIDSGNIKNQIKFEFKNFDDAEIIAAELSVHFDNPHLVYEAIYELLINAIEHGNLGLGYNTKSNLLLDGNYTEEIKKRLNSPENADKLATATIEKEGKSLKLTVQDQGKGFNLDDIPKCDTNALRKPNGRGIYKANQTFDRVEYKNGGNEVICHLKEK